jgi:hypothetical protein
MSLEEDVKNIKQGLDNVQSDIGHSLNRIGISEDDQAARQRDLAQKMFNLQKTVDAVHKIVDKPGDPDHIKYIKAAGDSFAAMGGAASGLKDTILLAQAGRTQEAAAAGLKATASILKTIGPLMKFAPPPVSPIAASVLDALQGLCDFTATILNLTKPASPPELTLEQKIQKELQNVVMEGQIRKILAVEYDLNGVKRVVSQAVKGDPARKRRRPPSRWIRGRRPSATPRSLAAAARRSLCSNARCG